MNSILTSIKKMLGIEESYTHFDSDLIMHINSVFVILKQLGIGPENGFAIEDSSATWNDYLGSSKNLEFVKTYIYLKVRLLFDPPTSSAMIEAVNKNISELEWRINIEAETNTEVNQNG